PARSLEVLPVLAVMVDARIEPEGDRVREHRRADHAERVDVRGHVVLAGQLEEADPQVRGGPLVPLGMTALDRVQVRPEDGLELLGKYVDVDGREWLPEGPRGVAHHSDDL